MSRTVRRETIRCLIPKRCCGRWLAGLLLAVLPAVPATATTLPRGELEQAVRQLGLTPEEMIWPWELSPQIRDWLAGIAVGRDPVERLQVVFHHLLDESGRALEYDLATTGTAAEVFASGRANCLGFTLLFVGLAREIGVEARFLRVEGVENYRREGDLIFVSEHITAGYDVGSSTRVVEFTLGPQVDYRSARAVSDLSVLALFYSNRGAEALRDEDAAAAVRWLEVAVRLDGTEAAAWTNLGVARRRLGGIDGAEQAYRRAIESDPEHVPAYMNLVGVLKMRGERDAVREILQLLDRRRNRNPYAYLAMGDFSLGQGRPDEARRFYRRAVRLSRGKAEPLAAMGQWALSRGDTEAARRWLRRARRIDESDARTKRLEQSLVRLQSPPDSPAEAGDPEQLEREVQSS